MADKQISALPLASTVQSSDSFVLEQNARAMRLTGQVLTSYLATVLDGHGGVNNITKTSTVGLTDTYTITYADLTSSTFTVTNGKGVSSITKTGTSGLTDTYTITYNDGTSSTFDVNNGDGIIDIQQTSTSGLVDVYTISLDSGATHTFEVTNGKGVSNISCASWLA